ncbi:NAD(P)-dependent oxidoreductase [Pseudomonas akapageensis]|uniref:NAD(P)-dependent oxidoreductase n=1 Tax=Pseudomonas akapageensis TaxID=2609961 RepID=UPI00140BD811|nr:NAD(P)-dependent oxidoreductase [Pseudomonas akapageensis]
MQIGFLGLGAMGRPMAANLLMAGHDVCVWNRSREVTTELVAQGAKVANSPAEAFDADVVISMLADDQSTREVILDSGALKGARPGLIHLSMATLSVAFVSELVARHAETGLAYVAAPVFGRSEVAAAGQLNILVAGPTDAVAKVQPLLDVLGQKCWPLGVDPVRANVVKIAGNFMLISAIEAMGEASALAQGHGVQAAELLEILTNTLFASPVYKGYGALIAERRVTEPAFKLALGLKDVGLALSAGEAKRVPLPFASVLRDALLEAMAQGEGQLDLAALGLRAMKRAGQL